jgi:bifunctional DNA-binding transcriptional regulator/antitoxin component of YhaV-PrlF toxin-antitoxin module
MIRLEAKKVRAYNGEKGLYVLKAVCVPAEKLPAEYLELKEPGDVCIIGRKDGNGILIRKFDPALGEIGNVTIEVGHTYKPEGYLERLEDIKKAGNRLTKIKRKLEAAWSGILTFKY